MKRVSEADEPKNGRSRVKNITFQSVFHNELQCVCYACRSQGINHLESFIGIANTRAFWLKLFLNFGYFTFFVMVHVRHFLEILKRKVNNLKYWVDNFVRFFKLNFPLHSIDRVAFSAILFNIIHIGFPRGQSYISCWYHVVCSIRDNTPNLQDLFVRII